MHRQMFNQQKQHYGIRKYAIGTSSVLLGMTLFITHDATAAENNTPAKTETNQAATISSRTSPTDVVQPNADTNATTATKETTPQSDSTALPQAAAQPQTGQTASKDTVDTNKTQTADSTTAPPVTDAPKLMTTQHSQKLRL